MSLSPRDQYQQQLGREGFFEDPAQGAVVEALQRVYEGLAAARPRRRWFRFWPKTAGPSGPMGLYIWGSVGCGKSFLMDLFFASVPGERKQRIHFHQFMQQIHERLKTVDNLADPLAVIAAEVADRVDLICFDEIQVHDVADAMLLGGLLSALFSRGVVVVGTSNRAPDELYLNGLQRERFLLTIGLIKQQMAVHHLNSDTDYRYRTLRQLTRYMTPLSAATSQAMAKAFEQAAGVTPQPGQIDINGRLVEVSGVGGDVVMFGFDELCGGPRSTHDYLAIAEQFHTLFLLGVPRLSIDDYDSAHRFMNLVDVLYDQKINLVISAETEPGDIYCGDRFHFEFERVVSRLIEMQSEDYLLSNKTDPSEE
ncbi:MAG: cell division protein ZapE [Immundisolibacteraceae bacterium]|nr:cell division protein ZapE [Immundisolibacteraceae bacterium]